MVLVPDPENVLFDKAGTRGRMGGNWVGSRERIACNGKVRRRVN